MYCISGSAVQVIITNSSGIKKETPTPCKKRRPCAQIGRPDQFSLAVTRWKGQQPSFRDDFCIDQTQRTAVDRLMVPFPCVVLLINLFFRAALKRVKSVLTLSKSRNFPVGFHQPFLCKINYRSKRFYLLPIHLYECFD
jgi:hypothetical protein